MKIYELKNCGSGYKFAAYYSNKDKATEDGKAYYEAYEIKAIDGRKTRWIKECGNGWTYFTVIDRNMGWDKEINF